MERRVQAKERVVTEEAIRRAAERSTRASALLEDRVVPAGYVPSVEIERYLAEHLPQA